MIKYLITTGCSFTDVPMKNFHTLKYVNIDDYPKFSFSWPVHLNNHLKSTPCYKGNGASGNGIISKTTIFEVLNALKKYDPTEILVGIMWSGAYRQEIYSTAPHLSHYNATESKNPTSIGGSNNWYKLMPYWEDDLSKFYYKNIYDDIGAYIETIENILRVQWFLKQYNIKYFMTQYWYPTFPDKNVILKNVDLKHLYDEIDFSNWLRVKSEFDWCKNYQDPRTWDDHPYDEKAEFVFKHPNTLQHKAFTEQVIIPHLQKKGYI